MFTDKERLDWLEAQYVEVYRPEPYGRSALFMASPVGPKSQIPPSLRALIDTELLK